MTKYLLSKKPFKKIQKREINFSKCQINLKDESIKDIENPILNDIDSSRFFKEEISSSFSQSVNSFLITSYFIKVAIHMRDLTKIYGNFIALNEVTLSIHEGEIFW